MRQRNYDDSDGDSTAASSSMDFDGSHGCIMPDEEHDRDAQITDDEAYPRPANISMRKSPTRSIAGSSSSIEIDDEEEEGGGEGSKTL